VEAPLSSVGAEADSWAGTDVSVRQIEEALGDLRRAELDDDVPVLRTSVMTHLAWVPEEWVEAATHTLEGLGERHPSRTILLLPEPDAAEDGLDSQVSVERFPMPGLERRIATEVIWLHLRGRRSLAPASVVEPLLLHDLPVFVRWRGLPDFDGEPFRQLMDVVDRLIVDSTEWPDLPAPYRPFAEFFDRVAASDIAWARTERWRRQLSTLWPGVERVERIRVTGTAAQANLLVGWLRARLKRPEIELEHDPADLLRGVEVDGEPAPFPPGDPPHPSELLSDELDRFGRDRTYEEAVRAT
jgi:Glucose-6-phosphate dehydrogenase subunit N-terminal domain/Glucose-6-phosphate dehydrogenase subunit C-terminal domain